MHYDEYFLSYKCSHMAAVEPLQGTLPSTFSMDFITGEFSLTPQKWNEGQDGRHPYCCI